MKKLRATACWLGSHKMKVNPVASIKNVDGRWVMIKQYCERCGHEVNTWAI